LFGKQATEEFQQKLNIDLIIRGHQVAQEGFEFLHDKKCLTIFSAPYYCGELNNKAGILYVAESLHCTIYQFRGAQKVGQHGKCDTSQNKEEKPKAKHDELLKKAISMNDQQKKRREKKESMKQRKTKNLDH
ncbi:hypothetical protein WUBG_07829, partial [Wuchereria bancrofti]